MDEKGYHFALGYLARRPHSEQEVRDYLKKKMISLHAIDLIVSRLKDLKFLNDEEFVLWWIRQRTEFKPKGKRLIEMELRKKGIHVDLIEKVYAYTQSQDLFTSDKDKAIALLQKRKGKYLGLEKHVLYRKAGDFLARRGFDWEIVKRSIDEVFGK